MLRDSKRKSAVNLFVFPPMPGVVLSLLQSFVCSGEILNKEDLSSPLPPNEAEVKGQRLALLPVERLELKTWGQYGQHCLRNLYELVIS